MQANGKRRKKMITSIENEGVRLTEDKDIEEHVNLLYKELFGGKASGGVTLMNEAWGTEEKITQEENEELIRPFTEEVVINTIKGMKENTAPGPDGFGVVFYKNC